MDAEEARRLKELEVENARLKRLLAEARPQDRLRGKALAPEDKPKAIARMLEHARISERRACRLAGLSRDAWRHPAARRLHNPAARAHPHRGHAAGALRVSPCA